jgi:hypothetical protein
MALTIKSVFKIFLLFLVFQIGINIFVETMPLIDDNISEKNQDYLNFLTLKVNAKFDSTNDLTAEETAVSLRQNFISDLNTFNYFSGNVLAQFFGALIVIGLIIKFIIFLVINLLLTPGIIISILLYNFIFSSSYIFILEIIVSLSFGVTLWYIIFKRRISQN